MNTSRESTAYVLGDTFASRADLAASGCHRPTQAGICGSQGSPAESIVISGGYEDDEDYFDVVIYTGHGGNDPATKKQVADQILTRGNMSLAKSCDSGSPIRVIRGADVRNPHAPTSGYRYDGLYRVERYWHESGKSGFRIYRFRLERIESGVPGFAPANRLGEPKDEYDPTHRVEQKVVRIVRDTDLARKLKELYEFRCQVCGTVLMLSTGPYAEASHIQPLGRPHCGPDDAANLLCLCPNHHVLFDSGMIAVADDMTLLGLDGGLYVHPSHSIDVRFLRYHREHIYNG